MVSFSKITFFPPICRFLIDALHEDCPFPNWRVCLRHLTKYATQKKNEANVDGRTCTFLIGEGIVILIARRYIVPFKQLRFDYVDKVAQFFLTTAVEHNPLSISVFI